MFQPSYIIPIPNNTPPLARAFTIIMQNLRFAIGQRPAPLHPLTRQWLALLAARVGRLSVWLARLALRAEAGRATPRPRPARPAAEISAPPEIPRLRLPEKPDWLFGLVPEAATFGAQLTDLLNQPETAALLEQAPHAKRMLRPLCRMLGIDLGHLATIDLRRPKRVRPARPKPPSEPVRPEPAPPAPPPAPPPPTRPAPTPASVRRLGWAGVLAFRREL